MKKRLWKKLVVILFAVVILVTLVACDSDKPSNPYSKTVREGWDMFASLDVLVRTEYNKDENPIAQDFYHVDTMEKESTLRYVYDNTGKLCDLVMGSDGFFTLLYDENGIATAAFPKYDNDYELSFTWDESGKLIAETVTDSIFTLGLTYDENGQVSCEDYSKHTGPLHYIHEKNGTNITVKDASDYPIWTVTLDGAGLPSIVTHYGRVNTYTFNDKDLCTEVLVGLAEKISNSYSKNGELVKQQIDSFDGEGKVKESSVCDFEYDSSGTLVKRTETVTDRLNGEYVSGLAEWEYDENGNLAKENVIGYYVGGKVRDKDTVVYTHDENGNLIQKKEKVYKNGELFERHEWDYTAEGALMQHIVQRTFDRNGLARDQLTETYNERRQVVLSKSASFDYDGKVESLYKYEYNTDDILTKETYQSFYKEQLHKEITKEYYESGTLKSRVQVRYEDDKATETNAEYYDEDGNLSKTVAATHNDTGRISSQETVEYRNDGKKLRVARSFFSGKMYDRYVLEYEYDADGNKIKETDTEYDTNGSLKHQKYSIYNTDGKRLEWAETEYKNGKQIKKTLNSREYNDKGERTLDTILVYGAADQLKSKTMVYLSENMHIDKEIHITYDENGNETFRSETVNP